MVNLKVSPKGEGFNPNIQTIKIINGGCGARGSDGYIGIVTKDKETDGLIGHNNCFNVKIEQDGVNETWRVSVDGEYEIIQKAINQSTYKTKFNFDDEVYLLREKLAEIKCNMCNGECVIDNPINQIKIKCPYCKGAGKIILDNTKFWYVIDKPFKVIEMRIKAHSQDNYSVKYGVRQTLGSKYNPAEMNMFSTKELAQLECDNRNRPAKRIDLKDIQISRDFESTMPNSDKIKACYDYYKFNNKLNKDIIVDKHNILVDGYVAYLVYKMLGKENVRVFIC